ncbi:hypothetical protein, partial [Komagataeibacter nataicola]|uniref:hypothetical protein n=1 Tax=Komagataeibacter nataicola TaxID=265960 RepID=UPI00223118DA
MSRHSSPPGQPARPLAGARGLTENRVGSSHMGKGRHRTMDANIMDQTKPAIPTLGRYAQLDRVQWPHDMR